VTVAREGSFTRAPAQLGLSPSALSHTVSALEARLGVRLLTRTTRKVALTEAGARLLATLAPRFQEIEAALVTDMDDERVDATFRLGEHVARDMAALPIGPALRMAVVGSPAYFARAGLPALPQQLATHSCIHVPDAPAWSFARDGAPVNVRVDGQVACDGAAQARLAALAGLGLARVLEDVVRDDVAAGRLVRVLDDWCAPFAGYHLYYPKRRQQDAAFGLLLAALSSSAAADRP